MLNKSKTLYQTEIEKPMICVCNYLFDNDNAVIGIVFDYNKKRWEKESSKVDKNIRHIIGSKNYYYYDVKEIYNFIKNKKIPQVSSCSGTYSYNISEKRLNNLFKLNIGLNTKNQEMFFYEKGSKKTKCIYSDDLLPKYLFPEKKFKWGAGWEVKTPYISKTEIELKESNEILFEEKIKKQIMFYLKRPDIFINKVNEAIKLKKRKFNSERKIDQIKREKDLKDKSYKYSLPKLEDTVLKNINDTVILYDKRFNNKYGYESSDFLKQIKAFGKVKNKEDFNDLDKKDFYNKIKPLTWNNYIIDISREYDLPFFENSLLTWSDDYLNYEEGKYTKEIEKELKRYSLNKNSSKNETYNYLNMNKFLKNDFYDKKYKLLEDMKNTKSNLTLDKFSLIKDIDFYSLIEEEENIVEQLKEYKRTDPTTITYKSNINEKKCYVLETMGDTIVFIKDKDLKEIESKINKELSEESLSFS